MRNNLLIIGLISLFLISGCSYFRENYRHTNFKMSNGTEIKNMVFFESTFPLSARTLMAYANDYPGKGKECDDPEFLVFSKQLWTDIVMQHDVSNLSYGQLRLLKSQTASTPTYCAHNYTKGTDGIWTLTSSSSN